MDACNQLAETLVTRMNDLGLFITTVESCTGGGLVNCITNVSGSSGILSGSRVTYSNEEKIELGVPEQVIADHTVYSNETAVAMAQVGIRAAVQADIGVGITGSLTRADPNNPNSKVGDVYIAVVYDDQIRHDFVSLGDEPVARWLTKNKIIKHTLQMILELLDEIEGPSL